MAEKQKANQSAKGTHIGQADRSSIAIVGNENIVYASSQPRIPMQLPERVDHFTNRERELVLIQGELQPGRVVTLCGRHWQNWP